MPNAVARMREWQIEKVGERYDEHAQAHVDIWLVRAQADIADWADALPDGLVSLDPILRPAA